MTFTKTAKKWLPRSVRRALVSVARSLLPATRLVTGSNLSALAVSCGTDKWGHHWYTQHYQRYFEPIKNQPLKILEIGVGGYENSSVGGESLRMWKNFFPKAQIVGIDICDKTKFREPRIEIRQCDQTDAVMLRKISEEYAGFDIVIDDGSHLNEHVIQTFGILFPLLASNGIYAIEDTQTSYWKKWGGGMDNPNSMMAFFKGLADGVNHVEYPIEKYVPSYFDKHIVEIAFFHNLIIVRKGDNDEAATSPNQIVAELEAAQASSAVGA